VAATTVVVWPELPNKTPLEEKEGLEKKEKKNEDPTELRSSLLEWRKKKTP